ncbi:MAG: hypothetical protein JO317_06550 [Verrucomicrobiae bacterium]|nr:hypothetical protein [Verrucomicrobiae bacterium]
MAALVVSFMPWAAPAADDSAAAYKIDPAKSTFNWKKDAAGLPEERDPMTPVGFVWPRPHAAGADPVRPTGTLALTIEFISYTDTDHFAKVAGFQDFLEEGKEYAFSSGGQKVSFKVERIEPTKVVVNYGGELLEFKPKSVPDEVPTKKF